MDDALTLGYRNPYNPREIVLKDNSAVFEISIFDGMIRLNSILAVERNQGAGTRAMNLLTQLADKHKVKMQLGAKPFGKLDDALDKRQLIKFYQKFGFVRKPYLLQSEKLSNQMIREPE